MLCSPISSCLTPRLKSVKIGGIVKGMGFFEVDIYVRQRGPNCRVLFELVNSHEAIVAFSIASIGKAIERPGAVVMYSQVTVEVAAADEA